MLNFSARVVRLVCAEPPTAVQRNRCHRGANCGGPAGLFGPGETFILDLGGFIPSNVRTDSGTLQIGKSGNDGELLVAYDGGGFRYSRQQGNSRRAGLLRWAGWRFFQNYLPPVRVRRSPLRGLSLRTKTVFNLVTPAGGGLLMLRALSRLPATTPERPSSRGPVPDAR